MTDELSDILRAAAGRLRRTRAVEAAAVGAVGGGLCAAAIEAGWLAASWSAAAGVVVCGLAAAGGGAVLWRPRLLGRLVLAGWERRCAGAVFLAGGLCGAAAVLAGTDAMVPRILPAAVLVPGAAAAFAAASPARRAGVLEAAIYHDMALGLAEQLSTAAEGGSGPMAKAVRRRALAAARRLRPDRRPTWRRTRATLGALALSVGLWAVPAALPGRVRTDLETRFRRITEQAAKLTPAGRGEVLRALRRLAERAERDPRVLAALKAAMRAAAADGPELPARLAELGDALADADDAEAAAIARALLKAMGLPEDTGGAAGLAAGGRAAGGSDTPGTGDAPAPTSRPTGPPGPAWVHVWQPEYQAPDANGPTASAPATGRFVPLRTAWSAARARARRALAGGTIPPEYRRLVRRFFELR